MFTNARINPRHLPPMPPALRRRVISALTTNDPARFSLADEVREHTTRQLARPHLLTLIR